MNGDGYSCLLDCNDFNELLNRMIDPMAIPSEGDCDDNDPRLGPWDVDGDGYSHVQGIV